MFFPYKYSQHTTEGALIFFYYPVSLLHLEMCMNNIVTSNMSTKCYLDCREPVHNILFLFLFIIIFFVYIKFSQI